MITKEFGKDFNSEGGALTLDITEVSDGEYTPSNNIKYSKTHKDGWTITGEIHEDYYEWVNDFEVVHPKFGKVWGNFEDKVFADSVEAFNDFFEKHKPMAWDYQDI